MKKHSFLFKPLLALSVLATIFSSCNKIAQSLQYNLTMQSATVTVTLPPYSSTGISVSGTQTNTLNIDSFVRANTGGLLGVNNIQSAKLDSCSIQLLNYNTNMNFANFSSCNASFYTNSNNSPITCNIASNPDVYSYYLSLPVDTTQELKGYFTNTNTFTYTVGGKLRRPTTDSLRAAITFTFKLHVQG